MADLECFVIMPIRREGTEEHAHFKAIYEGTLKPTLESSGFRVIRADEVAKSGAVTKDIVERLARADLVVADMTDLNPNVFWELGVRHALSGRGTITLLDEKRTPDVPFDLTPYRVIRYSGEIVGVGRLKERLASFVDALRAQETVPDSPVHDWLPTLPMRAIAATEHSTEGELRKRISELTKQVQHYERLYGRVSSDVSDPTERPLEVVLQALEDANTASDESGIRRRVNDSIEAQDVPMFLAAVRQVLEHNPAYYSPDLFIQTAIAARQLGHSRVAAAVLDHAHTGHPHVQQLTEAWVATLAQSLEASQRERARRELERMIGVKVGTDGAITVPSTLSEDGITQLGFMLDAYHRDGLHEQALRVTDAFLTAIPENVKLLRNHARALEYCGKSTDALDYYQRAVLSPKVDETAVIWFGQELHNRERHVDAVEAFALACRMDPNDGAYFAHTADDLSWAFVEESKMREQTPRTIPVGVSTETVLDLSVAALSCKVSADDVRRLEGALKRLDLDLSTIVQAVKNGEYVTANGRRSGMMDRKERVELAQYLYDLLRSRLTHKSVGAD